MENGKQTATGATPPQPVRKTSRKQWILHDGPNGSLHRLRVRMAEEGCCDSQLALAQQLLQEDTNESDQLAVHWLLRAAEQGHEEALTLLRSCMETRRGVTEKSYFEVRTCLSRPVIERSARNAARQLFSNLAHGSDFVSTNQLENVLLPGDPRNLHAPSHDVNGIEPMEQTVREVVNGPVGGELISEQHFISAASLYSEGHLPPFRLKFAPKGSFRDRFLSSNTSTRYLPFFLLITGGIGLFCKPESNVLLYCAIALLMAAVGVAITATVRTCRLQRDWQYFQSWSRLLQMHARDLQPYVPEGCFLRRFYPPHYSRFFMALVPCVILPPILLQISPLTLPFAIPQGSSAFLSDSYMDLPFGELALVAFFLCSLCWPAFQTTWAFTRPFDDFLCGLGWVLLRCDVNKILWDAEEDPANLAYQFSHVVIHLSLFSLLGAFLVGMTYIRQIRRLENAQDMIAWFLPHISSLAWLWLGIDWFRQATWPGLLRGLIGIAICAVWPVLTWTQVAIIAVVSSTHLVWSHGPIYLAVVEVCLVLLIYTKTKPYLINASQLSSTWIRKSPKIILTVLAALLAVLVLSCQHWFFDTNIVLEARTEPEAEILTPKFNYVPTEGFVEPEIPLETERTQDVDFEWQDYRNFCHEPAWEANSMARTQLLCASLGGSLVTWDGIVKQVQIVERSNLLESVLSWMPVSIANWLACKYGETWDQCNQISDWDDLERRRCQVLGTLAQKRGYTCHLNQWTKLELRIEIVPPGRFWEPKTAFFLRVYSNLQHVVLRLQPEDRILFTGKLLGPTLGGLQPEMELLNLSCQFCKAGNFDTSHLRNADGNFAGKLVTLGGKHILTSAQALMDFVLTPFLKVNVTGMFSTD